MMPASVAQLATVIGWPAALTLVEALPGQTIDVAAGETPVMAAVEARIGAAARRKLMAAYAGSSIYIPLCRRLARAETIRRIREAVRVLERDITTRAAVRRMALEWRVSERTIWNYLSYAREATATAPRLELLQLPLL